MRRLHTFYLEGMAGVQNQRIFTQYAESLKIHKAPTISHTKPSFAPILCNLTAKSSPGTLAVLMDVTFRKRCRQHASAPLRNGAFLLTFNQHRIFGQANAKHQKAVMRKNKRRNPTPPTRDSALKQATAKGLKGWNTPIDRIAGSQGRLPQIR
jgi:hypothetical protein